MKEVKNGLYYKAVTGEFIKINNHTEAESSLVVYFENDIEVKSWINGHDTDYMN